MLTYIAYACSCDIERTKSFVTMLLPFEGVIWSAADGAPNAWFNTKIVMLGIWTQAASEKASSNEVDALADALRSGFKDGLLLVHDTASVPPALSQFACIEMDSNGGVSRARVVAALEAVRQQYLKVIPSDHPDDRRAAIKSKWVRSIAAMILLVLVLTVGLSSDIRDFISTAVSGDVTIRDDDGRPQPVRPEIQGSGD